MNASWQCRMQVADLRGRHTGLHGSFQWELVSAVMVA